MRGVINNNNFTLNFLLKISKLFNFGLIMKFLCWFSCFQSGNGGAPPVPPQRHSSIRPNAPTTLVTQNSNFNSITNTNTNLNPALTNSYNNNNNISMNNNNTNTNNVSRLVVDLENKFAKRFHNVTEFPKPPPFLNIPKSYPSRVVKATNGM